MRPDPGRRAARVVEDLAHSVGCVEVALDDGEVRLGREGARRGRGRGPCEGEEAELLLFGAGVRGGTESVDERAPLLACRAEDEDRLQVDIVPSRSQMRQQWRGCVQLRMRGGWL